MIPIREERFSNAELNEIEGKLDGADEAREIEVCDEYDITRDDVYDFMRSRGYYWDDAWISKRPSI